MLRILDALLLVVGLAACSNEKVVATFDSVAVDSPDIPPVSTSIERESVPSTTSGRARPEPSQSPAAAQRDHVVPAVSALPLEVRSAPLLSVEADEGTWVLSQPSNQAPLLVGDTDGAHGIDFVSYTDYGELLLVGGDGAIDRAYPMAGFPPSWLLITTEAVFVGHVGDGGLPSSSIGRVDRTTLEAQHVVSPTPRFGDDYWPRDGWHLAPYGHDEWPIVMDEPAPDWFVPVDAAIGGTIHVDVAGIEQLLADSTSG